MNKLLVVAAILCVAGLLPVTAPAFEDGDWQVWNGYTVKGPLGDRWTFVLVEEFRIGDDAGDLYEEFIDIGLIHRFSSWLSAGVNYRHIFKESGGLWKMEKRPHWNATVSWKLGGLAFKNRSRMEWRNREGADDAWRFLNKLTAGLPPALTGSLVRPYLAAEAFLDVDDGDFNRYRLYAGFKKPVSHAFSIDLHYMRQATESGNDWTVYHVTRLGVVISF